MTRSHQILLRVMSALLLAILIAALLPAILIATAYADDPNFATINDPLNGDYEVFTVDDLLIFRTTPLDNGTKSHVNNYILETENNSISSQTESTVTEPGCYLTGDRQPQVTRVGRFFALDHDVTVTLSASENAGGSDCASTNGESNMGLYTTDFWTHREASAISTALAMDDFNLDGLDDLLIFNNAGVFAATAKVITDTSQGFTFGPVTAFGTGSLAPRTDPTSGDFNGDGLTDVAWAAFDNTVHFATVCPGDVAGTVCAGAQPLAVILDPLKSRDQVINTPTKPGECLISFVGWGVAVTAGDFASDGSDGLLTANLGGGQNDCTLWATWWEFNGDFSLEGGKAIEYLGLSPTYPVDVYATAAHLDWFGGGGEQVILGVGGQVASGCNVNAYHVQEWAIVLTFSGSTMTKHETMTQDSQCFSSGNVLGQYPWVNGTAVGHFSSIPANPNTESDFNLQIANLINNGSVRIYTVDAPTDYTPKLVSTTTLDAGLGLYERPETGGTNQTNQINWLVAGDLQGRSMRLGAPTVIRVNQHSQPSIILDAPPMHVDYVLPDESTSTVTQTVNFSAAPDSYNSTYSLSSTTGKQSSSTNTSSYSYAYSESAEEKFKLGVPLISNISGDLKQAWQQKAETTTEQYAFTQDEYTFNAATTTGLEDEIWFSTDDFNVYFYPVLGQTVTVTDTQGMTTTQPLFVSFSGPSDTPQEGSIMPATADTIEWYQPVHETGQIFSYPWTLQLLEQQSPGSQLLTAGTESFFTDDSGTTESVSWSQNQGTSQTTGSSHTHSFETDNSLSAGSIPDAGSGFEATGSFDYNNSTAFSNLNQSSTSLGQSQGVTIVKPKFPNDSLYKYLVSPVIFGQAPSVPPVQTLDLNTDIQTSGPVHTAYTADPTASNAGSWWTSDVSPYTQYIDVALNHPARWSIDSTGSGLACVVGDCAIPAQPLSNDLWNSTFYHMRGLLVTVGGFNGPQRTQATVGDDIFLQARVYNYSLKDMPAGSMIHVRFYRQQIAGTTPTGNSVLIAEATANPLPGFDSSAHPDQPNWTTVTTSFAATSDMGDNYYIFWVLVWVEQNNAMVPELPGHGLTAMPGSLASIGDVPLEMVTITTADGVQQQTSFTNNVGMYKQKFYVAPASPTLSGTAEGTLSLANVRVTAAPQLGKRTYLLSGDVRAWQAPASGVEVLAINGDPEAASARILDADVLPYISACGSDAFSMPIRADQCGSQEVVVVARTGAANHAQQIVSYRVPCPPIYLPVAMK